MACPNAGCGRPIDAAEWVKWANKKMGYNVRYWEIGNELGGSWEAGHGAAAWQGPAHRRDVHQALQRHGHRHA